MRLPIDRQDDFLAESRGVLQAGLHTAPWISVDDTGARHAGRNGFCTPAKGGMAHRRRPPDS